MVPLRRVPYALCQGMSGNVLVSTPDWHASDLRSRPSQCHGPGVVAAFLQNATTSYRFWFQCSYGTNVNILLCSILMQCNETENVALTLEHNNTSWLLGFARVTSPLPSPSLPSPPLPSPPLPSPPLPPLPSPPLPSPPLPSHPLPSPPLPSLPSPPLPWRGGPGEGRGVPGYRQWWKCEWCSRCA